MSLFLRKNCGCSAEQCKYGYYFIHKQGMLNIFLFIMDIKNRLDLIIKELGISGRQFARECGFSESYYPKINEGIGANNLNKILSKFPQISADWLLTGEGEMFKSNMQELSIEQDKDDSAGVFLSKDILELLKNQSEAIASQQRTIELLTRQKGHDVQQEEAADCADVG